MMTWYAASVLLAYENIDAPRRRWHVWENVVLIEASSPAEAAAKARAYGEAEANDSGALEMDDHLATPRFIGVRKILTIANPPEVDIDQSDHPPVNGTEITFTEFVVESRDDLEKLARGDAVSLTYLEYPVAGRGT